MEPASVYNAGVMENARLLRLMGIDVWRPRARPPSQTPLPPQVAPPSRTPSRPQVASPSRPQVAPPSTPSEPRERAAPAEPRERAAPALDPVEPFRVVCLSNGGALLLVEAREQRFPLRFCSDLLRAFGGTGAPQQVVFSWPQPGLEPGTGHAGRSLAAFIDKQLGDAGPLRLLVCNRTWERVPDLRWPDPVLKMPGLDQLLLEADLKKALWLQIRRVAAAASGHRTA